MAVRTPSHYPTHRILTADDYLERGSDEVAKKIIRVLLADISKLETECAEFDRKLTEAAEGDNVRYWDGEIDEA